MERLPVYRSGQSVGTLELEQDGLYWRMSAVCRGAPLRAASARQPTLSSKTVFRLFPASKKSVPAFRVTVSPGSCVTAQTPR